MLPRWHILLGAVFTLIVWIVAPQTKPLYLALIFLSSFLIDFDHYLDSVIKTKKFSLKNAFIYHEKLIKQFISKKKKGIRERGPFHPFHTIEFHVLIAIIGFFYTPFFYIFLGMIFHSLLDVAGMLHQDWLFLREFFFFNWLRNRF